VKRQDARKDQILKLFNQEYKRVQYQYNTNKKKAAPGGRVRVEKKVQIVRERAPREREVLIAEEEPAAKQEQEESFLTKLKHAINQQKIEIEHECKLIEQDDGYKYDEKDFQFKIKSYKKLVDQYKEQLAQEEIKKQIRKKKQARAARRFLKDLDDQMTKTEKEL
jgi:hypothetical protein